MLLGNVPDRAYLWRFFLCRLNNKLLLLFLLLYRTACSPRTSLTQLFACPGLVPWGSTSVQAVANAGTSHSTVLNVQLLCQLTALFTCGRAMVKIFTASAILRGIVTRSTKEGCAWDSGSAIVTVVVALVMPAQAGNQCPGSLLKRFPKLRHRSSLNPSILCKRFRSNGR